MGTWFEYPIHVHPHHTDYAGITWHGAYIAWMEEARIACLRSQGVEYADLVAIGCDLPVFKLTIQYHRSVPMGSVAIVKTRMQPLQGVRMVWDYEIHRIQGQAGHSDKATELSVTAQVVLVPLDGAGKVMRRFPPLLKEALGIC